MPSSGPQSMDPQRWLEEHGDYLFGYAMARVQDRALAEDLVQETLLGAIQARDRFQGDSTERTWLVGILKHKIFDYFRRNHREIPVAELLGQDEAVESLFDTRGKWKEGPLPWRDDPHSYLDQKQFWQALVRCLEELPGRLGRVFALREMEGMGSEEICNLLNITPTNLGVLLHRARMRLRKCLEIAWLGNSPGRQ